MTLVDVKTRKWTRDEYYRMADLGFFQDQRVELIEGEIVQMAPQNNPHAVVTSLVQKALVRAFGDGYWVRTQMPLTVSEHSEPEPDVAVLKGNERSYLGGDHPRAGAALLVVEVSDSTIRFDRSHKASLYASAGVAEYWIVDLNATKIDVHRSPVPDPAERHGHRYADLRSFRAGEVITPLALPHAALQAADLLP